MEDLFQLVLKSYGIVGVMLLLPVAACVVLWKQNLALHAEVVAQSSVALDAQRHLLSPQAASELDIVKAALAGGLLCRLRALRRPGLRRQTFAEQVLFRLWFLLG